MGGDVPYRKKLIEVALPLDDINAEAAREKSIRHGHPSTLHLWWARRPLAACRAVLFAQLVDDPSAHPDQFPDEESQDKERERLFDIIRDLVKWENSTNEDVLEAARAEIRRSCDGNPPPILDPFAGGGSIPLEAQRLGLEAHASDLNPVAVLINKALIEIPPRWADHPPVHPEAENRTRWLGAEGLAEDVRRYGRWMRDEAERRIGGLYPKAVLPDGRQANVIAWIWARTVTCPNPACGATMPLASSFWLGKKKGKEAWINPIVERKAVRFEIGHDPGGPPDRRSSAAAPSSGASCAARRHRTPT
jgi:putative DNA methylase